MFHSHLVSVPALVLLCLPFLQGCGRESYEVRSIAVMIYAEPRPPIWRPDATGLPAPFDQGVEYSRELHVHPAGDDGTGDGSPEAPYASIVRALQEASPGTFAGSGEAGMAG